MKTEYTTRIMRAQRLTLVETIHSLKIYPYDNQEYVFIEIRKTELPNRKRASERWQEARVSIVPPNGSSNVVEARQYLSALQEACAIAARRDASPETVGEEEAE